MNNYMKPQKNRLCRFVLFLCLTAFFCCTDNLTVFSTAAAFSGTTGASGSSTGIEGGTSSVSGDGEEMSPAVITSVEAWYPYTNAYAFPQGSSVEALEEIIASSPYYLWCYTESGDEYTATVKWDFSGIDFTAVGLYYATGSLPAPEGTVFQEGLSLPEISIPVSIQAAGKPDINCIIVARGRLLFPWVTPPGNMEEISVRLSENNGPWVCLEEDFFYADREMLSVNTYRLTPGSSYRLQVDYDGGQTGILSFTYADEIVLEGYYDGDRDGGDAGGNPSGDVTQPAPENPDPSEPSGPSDDEENGSSDDGANGSSDDGANDSSGDGANGSSGKTDIPSTENDDTAGAGSGSDDAAQSPENPAPADPSSGDGDTALSEFFGEITDRISGTRLFMMLRTGNQRAVFSKQGITVSIPGDALPDTILEDDQIEITIQKEEDGGFSFLFSINGISLDSLPGVWVMLPYSPKPAADTLYLSDENAMEFPMTDYDDTANVASFCIGHTGTYRTTVKAAATASSGETAAPNENRQHRALLWLPACLLLVPVCAIFLRRRRK